MSPVYEGMLKEEMDAAAERHPDIEYQPVLIDATLAGLVSGAATEPLVIPCLNRDGDLLSDLVLPLFGSIAGAESVLLALDAELEPSAAMAEAPHGTAPALLGKDIANPMAMILAVAALLHYAGAGTPSRAVYEGVLETVASGHATPDLEGTPGPPSSPMPSSSLSAASSTCGQASAQRHRIGDVLEAATVSVEDENPTGFERAKTWAGEHPAVVFMSIVFVLGVFLSFKYSLEEVAQTGLNGLSTGSYVALGAVGLTLVYGILKLTNFAHGDLLTFGAYMAFVVSVSWEGPLLLGVLAAMVMTALLGLFFELLLWGPMRAKGAGFLQLVLMSIGLAFVIRSTIQFIAGGDPVFLDVDRSSASTPFDFIGIDLRLRNVLWISLAVGVSVLLLVGALLQFTLLGKKMRALSDSLDLAETTGHQHRVHRPDHLGFRRRTRWARRSAPRDGEPSEAGAWLRAPPPHLRRSRPRRHRQPVRSARGGADAWRLDRVGDDSARPHELEVRRRIRRLDLGVDHPPARCIR